MMSAGSRLVLRSSSQYGLQTGFTQYIDVSPGPSDKVDIQQYGIFLQLICNSQFTYANTQLLVKSTNDEQECGLPHVLFATHNIVLPNVNTLLLEDKIKSC